MISVSLPIPAYILVVSYNVALLMHPVQPSHPRVELLASNTLVIARLAGAFLLSRLINKWCNIPPPPPQGTAWQAMASRNLYLIAS
jgi:hypothetical protein